MANNIEFKYLNNSTLDPICGLTINYAVKVIAVLADLKGGEVKARGAVYTSDIIIEGDEITDSDGIIRIDVTNVFSDNTFLEIWQKFSNLKNYNVSIEITLESQKQEIPPYMYISQTNIPRELSAYNIQYDKNDVYFYDDLLYWDEWESFRVDEIVIDEELLKSIQTKKLEAQREFTKKLESFQNEITSQSILQIPVLNEYNPINITQIVTRCLELEVGTIENALAYTTDAGLIAETNRLNKIKTLIGQISNLYPSITIEDGEGIPYQNIGVIPDIFRGFGFYQKNGSIIATSYLLDTAVPDKKFECASYPESDIVILLNGQSIFGTKFEPSFSIDVSSVLEGKSITLVDGDILNLQVFFNCTYYNSKLIIKN